MIGNHHISSQIATGRAAEIGAERRAAQAPNQMAMVASPRATAGSDRRAAAEALRRHRHVHLPLIARGIAGLEPFNRVRAR